MSGTETGGVMTSREQFTLDVHKTPLTSQPPAQNVLLGYSADGTAVYSGSGGGGGGSATAATAVPHNVNVGGTVKRKRGRPRKYGPNGAMTLSLTPAPLPPATVSQSAGTFSPPPQPPPPSVPLGGGGGGGGSESHSSLKKGRGRPPGSSKKQQMEALGSAGVGFTPHIITVKAGEDVSSKIMSFSQHGPRAVCVLSASGTISNVTLRQAATSGGTATYEGRFDILSLSGSFLLTEVGGQRSRTGGLSVSLAGPDGRVLGGCVAGLLTAASPVQVIVGSFIADGRNDTKSISQMEPLSAPPKLTPGGGATGASSPQSHGTFSESSGGSPLNHSTGAFNNNNPQGISSMPWR
ncbi:hypothetical protein RHGRI_022224 [Rhododendron griersonianum]|uniref:AT-hook motif nuclear-localized protein n=1 Tax=Rhododendron griersonianum TaxID=479676 RepID=A0AAV6JS30_9ERIC|nr:hypothetical protein RHGRI_022224 [Rhododendron griersonianum]KAG5542626.1 hypothetical protein RHGRI_022224 [Rhododendron griersonianum]KAG5542628.1 hypothetical protein RHGRI_022224 [Rhododendron griersonianum]